MKKIYIKPEIVSVSIEAKPFMLTVSGEGTMNVRENLFEDDYWEEEEFEILEIEDKSVDFI
jgi:hypothetical protein